MMRKIFLLVFGDSMIDLTVYSADTGSFGIQKISYFSTDLGYSG